MKAIAPITMLLFCAIAYGQVVDYNNLINIHQATTTQTETIAKKAQRGTLIYNTDKNCLQIHTGNAFECLTVILGVDKTNDAWINDSANKTIKLNAQSDDKTARAAETEFVIKDNGNVGIATSAPTAKLHSKGSVRHENLPTTNAHKWILGTDDNGNVAASAVGNLSPNLVIGGEYTDAITTPVTVTANKGEEKEGAVASVAFTLARESFVHISYTLSISEILRADEGPITNGKAKVISTIPRIFNSKQTKVYESRFSIPFSTVNGYASGYYYFSQTVIRKLSPGDYTFDLSGGFYVTGSDNEGISGVFGNGPLDQIDIIAMPIF